MTQLLEFGFVFNHHCDWQLTNNQPKTMVYTCALTCIMVWQRFRGRWVECVIHQEPDVREEQHPYIPGADKQ